jgi:hypothetical protein
LSVGGIEFDEDEGELTVLAGGQIHLAPQSGPRSARGCYRPGLVAQAWSFSSRRRRRWPLLLLDLVQRQAQLGSRWRVGAMSCPDC